MEEESDLCVGQSLAEQVGKEHEMVVVNPDAVVGLGDAEEFPAEGLVDLFVGLEVFLLIDSVGRKIVEEGPNGLVAEAFVVVFDVASGEKDGGAVLTGELFGDLFYVLGL